MGQKETADYKDGYCQIDEIGGGGWLKNLSI